MRTRADLVRFVESLPITPERREVVLLELEDHVFEAMAELEARGVPPAEAERQAILALGESRALGSQLVEVDAAFAVSPRQAAVLGVRLGLLLAAVEVLALLVDSSAAPDVPSRLYFAVMFVALLLVCPWKAVRAFIAGVRASLLAEQSGDREKARRLQEPASNFLGAAMTASAAPFLFWIVAAGAGMPMGAMEGLLVRSVFGALAVTLSIGGLGGASFLLAGMRRR